MGNSKKSKKYSKTSYEAFSFDKLLSFKYVFEQIKRFWKFTWNDDSLASYISALIVSIILIKFVIFPVLGFTFNTDYPVVAIVSGSMEHKISNEIICSNRVQGVSSQKLDLNEYWDYCGDYYENNYDIQLDDFKDFKYNNGLNIGDVMVLYGKDTSEIEIGDVLVFVPQDERFYQQRGPVIHRVVNIYYEDGKRYFQTKGDHNGQSYLNFENKISEESVIGVGVFRVPYLGYPRLWLSQIIGF